MSKVIRMVAILGVLAFTVSCASSEAQSDFELDVDSDEIRVAISKEVARGVMEGLIGSELECDGDIDGHIRALLEKLDRDGPRSRATYRDDDTIIDARRRGSKLDLDIHGSGSGRIQATMPWKIADCMLGHPTTIDKTMASAVKVTVTNDDGKNFSFRMQ